MIKKIVNNLSGMSLLEVLLYMALASFMLSAVVFFIIQILDARVKNQAVLEVDAQGAMVMSAVNQIIRNSAVINSPAVGSSASSLSVDTYDSLKNPTVFNLSSGVFQMQEGASPAAPLTNSRITVSGLSFQNVSHTSTPGIIRWQFVVAYNNPLGRNAFQYQKTFIASSALRQP